MYPIKCSLTHEQGFDQIHIAGNPIYLTVYPASPVVHYPQSKEKQYYTEHKGALLVFETTGYEPLINPFFMQGLQVAINWYAKTQLRNPDIQIHLNNPRTLH